MFKTFLEFSLLEQSIITMVIIVAIISFVYAWFLRKDVLSRDKGTPEMINVWTDIKEGADAYLHRQLLTILPIILLMAVFLFLSVYIVPPSQYAQLEFREINLDANLIVALGRMIAFLMGGIFSLAVGQLGMRIAVEANIRVAQAARSSENGFKDALEIAYRGGAFTGMLTDGLGLLGGTLIFVFFGRASPDALLGFGFGGTLLALFMRVGGGIFTKAADIGADLVGKLEQGIPEDDPRNAGVIADLVGDNVGDCAGMAADIFESYEVTIVSTLILGLVLYSLSGWTEAYWLVFPLAVRGIGVVSSIIGTSLVPYFGRNRDAEKAMFQSYEVSSIITIVASTVLSIIYTGQWELGFLVSVGVALAISFNLQTSYFTATQHGPVQEIVKSARTGSATVILLGLSIGLESSAWAAIAVVATFVISALVYWGQPDFILYGIALVGIGMLSHTGNNIAMDSFGPIADNANGIGEMVGLEPEARRIMAELDAVGNTMKAITKGVAIASAVVAAVSLFAAFIQDVGLVASEIGIESPLAGGIRISVPLVFVGLMIGGALPWLFSALSLRAVTRAAGQMVEEIRYQCSDSRIMSGEIKPDYKRAVACSTRAAQKELIPLAVLTISVPVIVGLVLGLESLGGFLAGIIVSGQMLAVFMSSSGGAWDNAKKLVEDEVGVEIASVLSLRESDLVPDLGKGSARHKATVEADMVGDPLKDTAGPALNPMIKVVNLVSLLIAPLLVVYRHEFSDYFGSSEFSFLGNSYTIMMIEVVTWLIVLLLLFIVYWSITSSKRPASVFEPTEVKPVEENGLTVLKLKEKVKAWMRK